MRSRYYGIALAVVIAFSISYSALATVQGTVTDTDGIPVKATDITGYAPLWTGSIMAIGSMNEREKFTGKIDEVRIYNHRLEDAEIIRLYYE